MFISFIIPAYNEEALIGATIESIRIAAEAAGEPHEIIVVNDASTDRTAEVARQHDAIVIDVHKRQIAAVRNAGAKAARGDVFIFVDGDTMISTPTLNAALTALRDGAVGGGAAVRFDDSVTGMPKTLAAILVRMFIWARTAAGCFIFCTRFDFEAIGGFDEQFFASEELWISKALKRRGRFVMVREPVITSGRKIRMYGLASLLWQSARILARGLKGVKQREGLDVWYDGRREPTPPITGEAP